MQGYVAPSAFTITLVNLAAAAARESLKIDNTSVMYDDYAVQMSLGVATPTTSGNRAMYIWFGASVDGTNWTEPVTGADAGVTLGTNALRGPHIVPITVGTVMYDVTIPSVANFFGGNIPPLWNIIVENQCGGAFSATEPSIKYVRGLFFTT
jgi:hypothetical protein